MRPRLLKMLKRLHSGADDQPLQQTNKKQKKKANFNWFEEIKRERKRNVGVFYYLWVNKPNLLAAFFYRGSSLHQNITYINPHCFFFTDFVSFLLYCFFLYSCNLFALTWRKNQVKNINNWWVFTCFDISKAMSSAMPVPACINQVMEERKKWPHCDWMVNT